VSWNDRLIDQANTLYIGYRCRLMSTRPIKGAATSGVQSTNTMNCCFIRRFPIQRTKVEGEEAN
jgi:hypothetical protein